MILESNWLRLCVDMMSPDGVEIFGLGLLEEIPEIELAVNYALILL